MKMKFNGQDVTRTKLEEIPREGIHPHVFPVMLFSTTRLR
jgi:hypothetical protein